MLLPYEIRNDDHYPQGGVAAIIVPAAAGRANGPVDVVISQDDPEAPYLGPRGWQPVEYRWQSSPVRAAGSDLIVPLGERVTAQIEDYTPVRVELPDLKMQGMVMWAGITPPSTAISPAGDPGARGGSSFLTAPVAAVQPTAAPTAAMAAATPPDLPVMPVDPGPEEPVAPEPVVPPPLPVYPVNGGTVPDKKQTAGGARNDLALWLVLGLIVLLVAGAIGYFLQPVASNSEQPEESVQVPFPVSEPEPVPPPAPAVVEPVAPPPPEPPPPPAAPAPLTLAQIHANGLAAVDAGDFNEAWGYFRSAETQNYGPSLLYLARSLDTIDFRPGLYQQPNNIAAMQLYVRACTTGIAGALPAFAKMVEEITRLANAGDVIAMEILRLEVPKAKDVCR